MILGRFLEQTMERGVEFVMTSNYHPDQLYAAGLQRERFLPAIELIKSRLDVVSVDSGIDYRRLKMEKVQIYHVGADAPQQLEKIFQELKDVEEEKQPLDVEGRTIPYRKRAGGLVWFDFEALCGGPRSYADYVDLTKRFHTIILSGVPRMSAEAVGRGAALHLADRRAVRRAHQAGAVGRGAAGGAVHGRRELGGLPAHREPAARDAVGRVPAIASKAGIRSRCPRRLAGAASPAIRGCRTAGACPADRGARFFPESAPRA